MPARVDQDEQTTGGSTNRLSRGDSGVDGAGLPAVYRSEVHSTVHR
jgi:hypothetical protein